MRKFLDFISKYWKDLVIVIFLGFFFISVVGSLISCQGLVNANGKDNTIVISKPNDKGV